CAWTSRIGASRSENRRRLAHAHSFISFTPPQLLKSMLHAPQRSLKIPRLRDPHYSATPPRRHTPHPATNLDEPLRKAPTGRQPIARAVRPWSRRTND